MTSKDIEANKKMKYTIIFFCSNILYLSISLAEPCSILKDKVHVLNELLDTKPLSPFTYEILLELMNYETQLEECEEKEKRALLLQQAHQKSKKRSTSF